MNYKCGISKYFTVALMFLFLTSSFAADKTAQTKMQFLKISPSARSAAMGDAFTTVAGDANSIFYNPAGMAFTEGLSIMVNKNDWLADIGHFSTVLAYNADEWGAFSFNIINMSYGKFERTVISEHAWLGYESLGSFEVAEYAFGFGYAKKITDRFSLGGQVKYIYQNLGDVQSWNPQDKGLDGGYSEEDASRFEYKDDIVAYDLGTYYETGYNGISLAMSIQNFANSPVPLIFRYGMAVGINQLFWKNIPDHTLRLNIDLNQTKDYSDGYQAGLEYSWLGQIFLRGGYKLNYSEENFTFGAGINTAFQGTHIIIDYAYTEFELLGDVNRFSFGISY